MINRLFDRFRSKNETNRSDGDRVINIDFRLPSEIELRLTDEDRRLMWRGGNINDMLMYRVLEKARYKKVIEDINNRYRGREIGLRGVMTSVEGDTEGVWYGDEQITVASIDHVLDAGTEHIGRDVVLLAPAGKAEKLDEIPHRVGQFFANSIKVMLAREPRNNHLKSNLRPTILVFDLSPESGVEIIRGYEHKLPDGEKRKKVILGAYPIDVTNLLPPINE